MTSAGPTLRTPRAQSSRRTGRRPATARRLCGLGLGAGAAASAYWLVVRGDLTLDVGLGRRIFELGPHSVEIGAARQVVFDVVASPYLGRTPRAMADKLEVLERASDMVLAAHHTPVRAGLTATTVETVRFDPPTRIEFRLVRGPVPFVHETFLFREVEEGTRLEYQGQLGTDFWALGRLWGARVARRWEAAVADSFERIRAEAERRSGGATRHP